MSNVNATKILTCFLAFSSILISESALAQYKTLQDTTNLNKEYGKVSLAMAKLNTKLIEEKNKTAGYRSKTSSTADDAVNSAQDSKDQAAEATNGNTTDTRKAVRDAKKANRQAHDAQDAIADEKGNSKKINRLTARIKKEQNRLDELDTQRAAILAQLNPSVPK